MQKSWKYSDIHLCRSSEVMRCLKCGLMVRWLNLSYQTTQTLCWYLCLWVPYDIQMWTYEIEVYWKLHKIYFTTKDLNGRGMLRGREKGDVGGKGDAGGKGDVEGKGDVGGNKWCQAFVAVDGAGSSSIVVLCWHHLVGMCHRRLLVVVCRCSLSLVSCSRHRRMLSSPHTIVALHHRYTSLLGHCCAVSSLSSSHVCTVSLVHLGSTLPVSVHHCPVSQWSGLGWTWDGGYSPWCQK